MEKQFNDIHASGPGWLRRTGPPLALLLAAFILPFGRQTVFASTTYYVSSTGSDAHAGTQASPWLTLQHAEGAAQSGDTVYVAGGVYNENDATTHAWNVTKGIAWIAQGTVVVRGASTASRVLTLSGTATASWSGFTFDSQALHADVAVFATGTAAKTFTSCTFEGSTAVALALSGTGISFKNSTITSAKGDAIHTGAFGTLSFSGDTIAMTSGGVLLTQGIGTSLTMTGGSMSGVSSGGLLQITESGNYTIARNTITATGPSASILTATGQKGAINVQLNAITTSATLTNGGVLVTSGVWTANISGNTLHLGSTTQTGNAILVVNQLAPVINGNTIDTFGPSVSDISVTSSGVAGGVAVIENNIMRSRSTSGYGILVGADNPTGGDNHLDGALIESNTFDGAYYYTPSLASTTTPVSIHAIMVGYDRNAVVRYNTVIGAGYGIVLKHAGVPWTSGGVQYNALINCVGASALRVKGVQNLAVANNTIYNNPALPALSPPIDISANLSYQSSTGATLRNNIVDAAPTNDLLHLDQVSHTGFSSDYDLLYRPTGTRIALIGSTDYTSFSAWQKLGQDVHGKNADPLLASPATYDIALKAASTAINTGTSLGLTRDLAGTSVPIGGVPDMGALESTSVPTAVSVSRFSIARHAGSVVFRWHAHHSFGVIAWEIEAAGQRVLRHAAQTVSSYRVTVRHVPGGPFVLKALWGNGSFEQVGEVA